MEPHAALMPEGAQLSLGRNFGYLTILQLILLYLATACAELSSMVVINLEAFTPVSNQMSFGEPLHGPDHWPGANYRVYKPYHTLMTMARIISPATGKPIQKYFREHEDEQRY